MAEFEDYYASLQVTFDAEPEVIEKAYKALIFKYHPDHGGDVERAKSLTVAYATLSEPGRKAQYDRVYREHERAASGAQASHQQSSPANGFRVADIPPEVIDAILAASLAEAAAATVRTVGRAARAKVGEAISDAGAALINAASSSSGKRLRWPWDDGTAEVSDKALERHQRRHPG